LKNNLKNPIFEVPVLRAKIYTDGSFSKELNKYSFGCVIIAPDGEIIEEYGSGDKPEALSAWNVAGEALGVMRGVSWAIKNNYSSVELYCDYNGLEKWFSGEWKTNAYCSKEYMKFMNAAKSKIDIYFVKVKAHSGIVFNERADALAKKALFGND
jgi:ribonuclease HI